MLLIDSIEYKNLFSTGNSPTLIDFTKARNTLIVGKNGSGKSTISSALIFALYGKDFRGVKKNGLVNTINNKKLLTTCCFRKNGKKYKIVRGIKPDILEIYEDDVLLHAESSKKEQQDKFEQDILQFPYASFKQIVVTGSGQYIPFMKLSTPQRRDFIENLLQLGVFSSMQNRLKDYLSVEKDKEKDLKNSIFLNLEKAKIIQAEIDARKEKSEEKVIQLKIDIKNIDEKNNDLLSKIEKIVSNIETLKEKLESIDSEESLPYSTERVSSTNELTKINKLISDIEHLENCPTCRQKVSLEYKTEIKNSYREEIISLETKIESLNEKIIKLRKAEDLKTMISTKIADLGMSISDIQNQIRVNNGSKSFLENQINEIIRENAVANPDITDIKKKLIEDKEKLSKVTDQLALYQYAALILKDTGIKATIIKEYVDIINELVNNYLEKFDFFVNFNIDENFNETIRSRHRDEFTYENFSEGEKARIDLALLCTFREIAQRQSNLDCNLLILDEIFSSELDFDGVDQLKGCLQSMEDMNIVAISHDQTLIEKEWDRIIKFNKEGNFSVMEEVMT